MIVALIGCGGSGSAIAAQLAKNKKIENLILVDLNKIRVRPIIQQLNKINKNIEYTSYRINAQNEKDIKKVLKNVQVVINAASPLCNIPIMNACIKSGTNYIDLASDPFIYSGIKGKTAIDYQLKLHNSFLEKDLVAITNAGASPGFSDLLCKHAVKSNNLDSIEYIKIYFVEIIESSKFVASWSPYIMFLESVLPATVYNKNKIINLKSHERKKQIRFPLPIEEIEITLFNGHPELRTIPEFIDIPIKYIEIGGAVKLNDWDLDDIILESLRRKVNKSIIFHGDIFKILASSFEPTNNFINFFKKGFIQKELLCCLIEVVGKRKNRTLNYSASALIDLKKINKKEPLASASSFMVSILPTILTIKILDGKISEKGVIAPASLSNASEIVEECKKFDIGFTESMKWKND